MPNCFLSLGSNMGDRWGYLGRAREKISELCGSIVVSSSVYETAAWGNEHQSLFLNQVLQIATALSPEVLLLKCQEIEVSEERERIVKWGSRTLDIDILFFDELVCSGEHLVLPHPHIASRNFVLVPLAEIASDFVHPTLLQSIGQLLTDSKDPLEVYMTNP